MSNTQIIRTEKTVRGPFGKVVKWLFIIFNVLMACWMLSFCVAVGDAANNSGSSAETAGTALGGAIGSGLILFFWAAGSLILGLFVLFTRGKKIITEETRNA